MKIEEYNKRDDVCLIHPTEDTKLLFEIEEYIEAIYQSDFFYGGKIKKADYEKLMENVSKIPVYKKILPKISTGMLIEDIEDYLESNYGYDTYEFGSITDRLDTKDLDNFVKKFNTTFDFYTTHEELLGELDLREEVKKMIEEDDDIHISMTESEAFELYLKMGYDDIMDFKTFYYNKLGIEEFEESEA